MIRRDGRHDYLNQKRNGSMDKSEAETTTLPTDEEGASTSSRGSCRQYDAFHLQCLDLDNQRSELPERTAKKVDKCYRYVWSAKTQPPLKEMA